MAQGFALFAGIKPEVIRASAREAEALGYASLWLNHPGQTDGLAALVQAAGGGDTSDRPEDRGDSYHRAMLLTGQRPHAGLSGSAEKRASSFLCVSIP